MAEPEITMEPSKGVISAMAARIYSAYVVRGDVQEGEEDRYMKRSIRAAVRIAKTVERSVETEDVPKTDENALDPSNEASPSSVSAKPASKPAGATSGEG